VMTAAALVWACVLHGREAPVSPSEGAEHAVQDAR
jgi:hypothetical protein